jgi:nitrate reductase beta subunit
MSTAITRLPVTPENLVCPFCRAGAGKPCVTSGGQGLRTDSLGVVLVHVARIKRAAQANAKRVRQTHGKQLPTGNLMRKHS